MKNRILICSLTLATLCAPVYAGDVSRGKEKSALCVGCHGVDGIGISDEFPNLAGQKEAYIIKQLKAFRAGDRINPTMKAMTLSLTDTDIDDLATYFSKLSHTTIKQDSSTTIVTSKATKSEFPEDIFITMKKSGSVESFPSETVWKGGPNMLYNAVTPSGKVVLSTSPSTNSVYVFEAKNGKQLAIIPVGKAPKGVKVSPNGDVAYVSNQGSAEISVIDLHSLTVIDIIKVEDGPHNVRFTKDATLAYATLQGGAGIAVIDTATRKVNKTIPVPGITGPHNLDLSLDEKTAFVRDFVHHVAVLNLETGNVKKIIKVGNGHGGIDVSPNGQWVATAAIGDTYISVVDTKTLSIKTIEVGNGPHGIRFSKDSRWIYVTVTKDNTVVVIDAHIMELHKKIVVEEFPFWISVQGNP